jgi:peptidoglycan hydrolase CwlO-like protein
MGYSFGPVYRQAGVLLGIFLFGLILAAGITAYATQTLAQSTDTTGSTQTDSYRAGLQAQLDAVNAQIAQQQAILTQAQGQSTSLQKDINVLSAQIKSAQLAIKARDLNIQQLTAGISQKEDTVFGLNTQLNAA